ncbi:MAG: hypothetical protein RB292_02885 [Patescibacteria group bacterium]|jgi:hypothetical protein|nr:hypothetical protein [Patescibacteria group bacterium]
MENLIRNLIFIVGLIAIAIYFFVGWQGILALLATAAPLFFPLIMILIIGLSFKNTLKKNGIKTGSLADWQRQITKIIEESNNKINQTKK